ncbi:hypothetical protein COT50_01935 [candidate division WWE3 bacterium CG08_land_8_20_14_0_20_41_10]|uniref:Uncharacterized protein n=1 Tax=candidate division WWE3 bacterium CG08_land_8_20_14_0_20_41_10 TaxID=1975085 RepID=A0A2H0XBX0_UNCKA|nr:MAG: hypothetical protein COT50_01935 [candidate division WWE3 bacterium CG08_land_8_20_14_0_20_41_10]
MFKFMPKLLVLTVSGLILILASGFFVLFTPASPPISSKTSLSSGNVKIIGSLPKTDIKNKSSERKIAGGDNLCWVPPECQEIIERKGDDGWSQEELDKLTPEQRDTCVFGECQPFPGSVWAGDREKINLELSDAEVEELIKLYFPKDIKLKDIVLRFEESKIFVNAHSYYPFAPGFVTAEMTSNRYGFKLISLHLGKLPAPESLRKAVEDSIDAVIVDTLSGYGVTISIMEMQGDRFTVTGEAPRGLIKRENGVLVVNFDVLPRVTPAQDGGDMRIQ